MARKRKHYAGHYSRGSRGTVQKGTGRMLRTLFGALGGSSTKREIRRAKHRVRRVGF